MKDKIIGTWKLKKLEFLNFDEILKLFSEALSMPPEATQQIANELKSSFEKDLGKDFMAFFPDGSLNFIADNKKGTWNFNEQENTIKMTKEDEAQPMTALIKELTDNILDLYMEITQNGVTLKLTWEMEKV